MLFCCFLHQACAKLTASFDGPPHVTSEINIISAPTGVKTIQMTVWSHLPTIFRQHYTLRIVGIFAIFVALITTLIFAYDASAAPGVNQTVSFQGRLLTPSGGVVPDGYYNMQFKLYQDGSGTAAGNPGGTLTWSESYVNNGGTNGVQVRNGFFSVALGSNTPFGSSVDWNQDTLWLSMNVAGSAPACTTFGSAPCAADGEMLPMKRLTATPFALNAAKLGGRDASGFIQNSSAAQTADFNISGSGTANTLQGNVSVVAPLFDRANTGTLSIGTVNATSVVLGANTTIAAGKALTIAGGNTSTRPTSPTEGMMYFDTESKQLLVYANGKWRSDSKTNSQIVAASNSSQTTKDGANFVADGEQVVGSGTVDGDQAQINAAIAALAGARGVVFLAEGTYYLDASIILPSNVSLVGEPGATVITINNSVGNAFPFVSMTSTTNNKIRDITFNGNRVNNGNNPFIGVLVSGGTNVRVSDTTFTSFRGESVTVNSTSSTIYLSKNTFSDNLNWGVNITSSRNINLEGNSFTSGTGGVSFTGSQDSNINNNIFESLTSPLRLQNSSNQNTVASNTFKSNLENSVRIATSHHNTIVGNSFIDNGGTGAFSAVYIEGNANVNAISSNTFRDTAGTGYAIDVSALAADDTYISNNSLDSRPGANSINDLGTNTIFVNQYIGGKLVNKSSDGVAIKTSTDNTNAFSVQNAANTNILTVDTTSSRVLVSGALDTTAAASLTIGNTNATSINIGKTGVTTTVQGGLQTNSITSEVGQALILNGKNGAAIQVGDVIKASFNTTSVQIGDGGDTGTPTLLTLDKASSAPTVTDNALVGSMYYDTSLGAVQCYEAAGWGACSAAPDTFVTLSPEYANAVVNGTGTGTLSSDICSDTLDLNDGSSSQPTICGTNETQNFYKWTSNEVTEQVKSIFITYKLPGNFKQFVPASMTLKARTDSTNSSVGYQVYRKTDSGLTACGTMIATSQGAQSSWQTAAATATDPVTCSFAAGDSVVFKISLGARSNANAYVSDLSFAYKNNN